MQAKTVRSLQLGLVFSATLAALAFASGEPTSGITTPARITQIEKNQVWPLKGHITMNPCADFACVEL